MGAEIQRFMGPISSLLEPEADGQWVRHSDHEAALAKVRGERKQLLSAIKQHRNATESRLRMVNGREALDTMLEPDRDLYELAERIECEPSDGQGGER